MILKTIARKKNKQLYCVDEYLGEAHSVGFHYQIYLTSIVQAFKNLNSSVERLHDLDQITSEENKLFKQGLRVIQSFLQSLIFSLSLLQPSISAGYKTHIQESSEIAAHCATHALSDPLDSAFSSTCRHSHDYLCLQCEQVSKRNIRIIRY